MTNSSITPLLRRMQVDSTTAATRIQTFAFTEVVTLITTMLYQMGGMETCHNEVDGDTVVYAFLAPCEYGEVIPRIKVYLNTGHHVLLSLNPKRVKDHQFLDCNTLKFVKFTHIVDGVDRTDSFWDLVDAWADDLHKWK